MAGDTKTKPPRISKGGEWAFGGTEIDSIGLVSLGHKRVKEIARERERERDTDCRLFIPRLSKIITPQIKVKVPELRAVSPSLGRLLPATNPHAR